MALIANAVKHGAQHCNCIHGAQSQQNLRYGVNGYGTERNV